MLQPSAYATDSVETLVRGKLYSHIVKRTFDLVAILAAAPIVLPVVLLLALFIRRDGARPSSRRSAPVVTGVSSGWSSSAPW